MRCASRGRKTWYECVKGDMKVLGLHPEWAVFRPGYVEGLHFGRKVQPLLIVERLTIVF